MIETVRRHWPEYAMEAAGLGFFMIAACSFAVALEHPVSPLHALIPALPRRALMGVAMGMTAIAITYSPWGKQSGAHINPAITWTFYRLGKIERWDAIFYAIAQFAGAVVGVWIAILVLGALISHPAINYVATVPGPAGIFLAFAAELSMAFVMMSVILKVTNHPRIARFTGIFAGILVATFITFENPISGMSINPARTFGSALSARTWTTLWLYFTAPPLGMVIAAEIYLRRRGASSILCAKLHHENDRRCIFRCGFARSSQVSELRTRIS